MIELLVIENSSLFSNIQKEKLGRILSEDIHSKSKTFRYWQDQQAFICGRYLLYIGLESIGFPTELIKKLHYSQFGKPYFDQELDFSISHSGKFVILAISKHCKLGVDIEEIGDVDIECFKNCFNDKEIAKIRNSHNPKLTFYSLWTLKEAFSKALGFGLSLDLKEIQISSIGIIDYGNTKWFSKKLEIAKEYQASIVCNSDILNDVTPKYVTI